MRIQQLIAAAGLSGLAAAAVVPPGLQTRDDPEFVYEQAYRIRIAKNGDYSSTYSNSDYDSILPGLPDSDSQLSTWWFGYQSAGLYDTNIAVAQLWPSAVYYEQVYHSDFSSTWKAYTDHEKWFRLSFKAQSLDEFDPDYPAEHNVFVNRDGDLALGAPAPTHPPSIWGPAPGTYLVCRREFQRRGVLAVRFAYSVLNETENIPRGCVPVKLESRCAPLDPLFSNKTWNHDEIITTPCVKDGHILSKNAV
ncbi:ubiquitin-specific protease doa4 [Pestalotiopsis sp. IQ-011]